jgi:hypothetical protein
MSYTSSWYLSYKYWKKTKLSNFKGELIEETFNEIYEFFFLEKLRLNLRDRF